ncbi:response regulator [Actinokineospora globicatena]|uniref:Response regulator n=1 Tax=Actinokineospora globicatena TaxID=103729 RepID=A0A9W6V7U5_9PSEU|nr:response regulator [Actinokineospora globicatena]MCP2306200.1 two-component system, chemotaxis family, response regulator CheY [Actinokineospora globicatena]GLW81623.1 response regulator [Actinokineospora globicatena]GLW88417.1 response regulator [Actinokineospora globicatena]GLW93170.1 response regulator [Actinokineospora globicatena]
MLGIVIDDSRAMRKILRGLLADLGFEVLEAGNGREALDLLQSTGRVPDLALVDWNMPVMTGLEFVIDVRKIAEMRQMTLMMVTTESEHGQIVRALAAGAHEYVIKPFTRDGIIDKLALLGLVPVGVSS